MPIWVSEPIGLARPWRIGFDAGDEGGGDGAHAGQQDAELAGGGADDGGVRHVGKNLPAQGRAMRPERAGGKNARGAAASPIYLFDHQYKNHL